MLSLIALASMGLNVPAPAPVSLSHAIQGITSIGDNRGLVTGVGDAVYLKARLPGQPLANMFSVGDNLVTAPLAAPPHKQTKYLSLNSLSPVSNSIV